MLGLQTLVVIVLAPTIHILCTTNVQIEAEPVPEGFHPNLLWPPTAVSSFYLTRKNCCIHRLLCVWAQAGLVLGLFGGTIRNSEVATRSDPHVLVVGDPGLGKSQVRKAYTGLVQTGKGQSHEEPLLMIQYNFNIL